MTCLCFRLINSTLFPIINSMPKGAVQHLHYSASVSIEWLISFATYLPNCYLYNSSNGSIKYGSFKFFESDPKDQNWKLVSTMRSKRERSF